MFLEVRDYQTVRGSWRLGVPEVQFEAGVNVLLGPNGAGKTTFLSSMTRRARRTHGSFTLVDGEERRPLIGADVALLPQNPQLPTNMTVSEVLMYAAYIRGAGISRDEACRRLEEFGLSSLDGRRAGRLSGGEEQRLNLAIALTGGPKVILLDEPTVALDPPTREEFGRRLRSALAPDSVVLLSSHLPSDIDYADAVFLMAHETIVWRGTPSEFLSASPDRRFDDAFGRMLQLQRPR